MVYLKAIPSLYDVNVMNENCWFIVLSTCLRPMTSKLRRLEFSIWNKLFLESNITFYFLI